MKAQAAERELNPFAEEIEQDGDQSAEVQRYVEGDAGILPVQQVWNQNQMRRAADGQKFGEALHDCENDCLPQRHRFSVLPSDGSGRRKFIRALFLKWKSFGHGERVAPAGIVIFFDPAITIAMLGPEGNRGIDRKSVV